MRLEEPELALMSDAERSAAVAALTEILLQGGPGSRPPIAHPATGSGCEDEAHRFADDRNVPRCSMRHRQGPEEDANRSGVDGTPPCPERLSRPATTGRRRAGRLRRPVAPEQTVDHQVYEAVAVVLALPLGAFVRESARLRGSPHGRVAGQRLYFQAA